MFKITLQEARSKGAPAGGGQSGYEFFAPLDEARATSTSSPGRRSAHAASCIVSITARSWSGGCWCIALAARAAPHGRSITRPGTNDDEEQGYRFASHAFQTGEYVSVRDGDGDLKTYRVETVTPA